MATHFKIERPDGTSEEVESTKTILKIKSKDGVEIEVPAFTTHHIMSLHLKGEEAGSAMGGGPLEFSFGVVAEHLPRELPFKGEVAAFEMDVEQNTGRTYAFGEFILPSQHPHYVRKRCGCGTHSS